MGWYRDLKAVLQGEPETWLAYLHGQHMDNLPLLTSKRRRYRGLFLLIVKFGVLLLRDLRLNQPLELKCRSNFFIFAGSANQLTSLEQTIESLRTRGEKLVCIEGAGIDDD